MVARADYRANYSYLDLELSLLTQHPEPVVDGDDDRVAVGGHDGAVPEVAAAPVEAVPVDEEQNRQPGVLDVACRS